MFARAKRHMLNVKRKLNFQFREGDGLLADFKEIFRGSFFKINISDDRLHANSCNAKGYLNVKFALWVCQAPGVTSVI